MKFWANPTCLWSLTVGKVEINVKNATLEELYKQFWKTCPSWKNRTYTKWGKQTRW